MRNLTIHEEENPRHAVTANDAFAASVMGCRNLAGEALAPYFVCSKNADVADDFDIPGTIIDTSTGKQQDAQWIRGTAKRSFDGLTSIDARDAATVGDENTSNARFSRLVAHVEATCAWTDSSSSS